MSATTRCLLALLVVSQPLAALAAVEHYKIDPLHTFPSLEFDHMGLSVWRGKFKKTSGAIELDRAAHTGSVNIKIDPASIDWGLDAMDTNSRSESFLYVEKYPTAEYVGKIVFDGDKPATVDGQLTFRGVTRPLALKLDLFNCMLHPMLKKQVCGADASGSLNWSDYGIKTPWATAGADQVRLHISVEALLQD